MFIRRVRWYLALLLVLSFPVIVSAYTNAPTTGEALSLRILSFNIWVGGELVNFDQVVEAIRAADADIVGLQEPGGNTARIAAALGWSHISERMHIISRFPLLDPPDGDGIYLFAQVSPGQVIALSNLHLPSDPYGPYLLRDGATLEDVLQNEADTRLPALQPFLDVLPGLAERGYPVLLTGDFNAPSHLDWAQQVGLVEHVSIPVEWPVSLAMEAAGFTDTYRAVHPDPAARIGMTWTPGYPVPRLRPGEVVDRIDYVYAAGPVTVLDSQIVGEVGGPDVDIAVEPYPSDHRGVVSTVHVVPAAPPLLTAVKDRVITQGEEIVVYYHAPEGEQSDRIVIVPAGGAPADGLMSLPPMEADFHGAVTFGSHTLAAGEYAALLVSGDGAELSRSPFWVLSPMAVPMVRAGKSSFSEGEAITVEWANLPGHRYDWIGVYPAGESDLYNYLAFAYTGAASSGSLVMDDLDLTPGDYELRAMRDDWYVVLASAPFSVEG